MTIRGSMLMGFAALTLATPVLAQQASDLPDRPVTRAEVTALLVRQFKAMDANHDGVVSEREFAVYRDRQPEASGGMSAFEHVGGHWFDRADADGDGHVTLAEAEARPLHLFDLADVNRDGVVSPSEAQTAMRLMSLFK